MPDVNWENKLLREKFDYVTARAVAPMNILLEYCMPFVEIGGKFISYKANAEEEIIEAKNAIKTLGGKIDKVKNYNFFLHLHLLLHQVL